MAPWTADTGLPRHIGRHPFTGQKTMSLSKRDTFVRWLDPLHTIWEDANGNIHYSLVNMLKAFRLKNNYQNRKKVSEMIRELLAAHGPDQQPKEIIEREQPDSPEYFNQKTQ